MKVKSPIPGVVRRVILATHAGAPDDEIRASYGQAVANDVADLRDLVRIGSAVLPASVLDELRAHRGDSDARDRVEARRQIDQLRVALTDVADVPGLLPRGLVPAAGDLGLGFAVPIVREHALELTDESGTSGVNPVLPGVVEGSTEGMVDPGTVEDSTDVIGIGDVGGDEEWHIGASVAGMSKQILDWSDSSGERVLDGIVRDVADRAAERAIVSKLEAAAAAAGGTRAVASGALTDALDAAESAASASAQGATRLLIVAPEDWPAVRRAIAQTWVMPPAPAVAVSSGATPGTATLLGPAAAHLLVRSQLTGIKDSPAKWSSELYVVRPFYAAVRDDAQIQTVTGI